MPPLVFVVVRDEGEYSSRDWDVCAVCSTRDAARDRACQLAVAWFRDLADHEKLYNLEVPPFGIETWHLDGPRQAEPERCPGTMHQAASMTKDAELRFELAAIEKIKVERAERQQRNRETAKRNGNLSKARTELEQRVLSGEMTDQQYRAALGELVMAF